MDTMLDSLQMLIDESAARHSHLCPRQILGIRLGLAGARSIGLPAPRSDKRLLVISETDGCFVDGVEVAAGVSVGHRTLRIEDYGMTAATFVDVCSGQAVRVEPWTDLRERAALAVPDEERHYFAQMQAYQIMPDEAMFTFQAVALTTPVEAIISKPKMRVNCAVCGAEIMNEREIIRDGVPLCRACAGPDRKSVA